MNKLEMKESINETTDYLAVNLLLLLKAHNMNGSDLAKKLNIPYNTIHRLLTGETLYPRIFTLQQIGDYFGVGLDFILNKPTFNNLSDKKENIVVPVFNWNKFTNQILYKKKTVTKILFPLQT